MALGSPFRINRERRRAEAGESAARRSVYAADMRLAQAAWEQNSVRRVHQTLEETVAYENRGFEWYYWQFHLAHEPAIMGGTFPFDNH